MYRRILKTSAIAAVTFLAGAPLVAWLVPQARSSADTGPAAIPARVVPIALEIEPGDLFNETADLLARRLDTDDEGVSHTQVFTIDGGIARVRRVLQNCVPVAWSPVCESVLLLREAAPDDDLRHFAIDIEQPVDGERRHLGCRHCWFRTWQPERDAVVFDCETGHTDVFAATGGTPVSIAASTGG